MTQNNGNGNDHATLIMEDQTSPRVSAPTLQSNLEAEAVLERVETLEMLKRVVLDVERSSQKSEI